MTIVYVAASFLSAVLVFSVQPLASKMLLPDFGGSAAVWTTSVLFFQVVLLLGYGYSHVATNRLAPRRQVALHLLLLAVPLVVLPLSVTATPGEGSTMSVIVRLLAGLAAGVGLPFLLVSTSGPLLQRWFSWTDHERAHDPYFLYAASNVGSILGLLSYPMVIESMLDLSEQASTWTGGYGLLVLLVVGCALYVYRTHNAKVVAGQSGAPGGVRNPSGKEGQEAGTATVAVAAGGTNQFGGGMGSVTEGGDGKARTVHGGEADAGVVEAAGPGGDAIGTPISWTALAFVPSSLMLGVTTFLTTDLASIPLLWVVPLAVYLGTFVVAFGPASARVARGCRKLVAPVTLVAALAWLGKLSISLTVGLVVVSFATLAMIFHHRLAASRPEPGRLTAFYVWMSLGGALGGFANSILAPLLLPGPFEFVLVVVVAAAVAGEGLPRLVGGPSRLRYWLSVATIFAATIGSGILLAGGGPARGGVVVVVGAMAVWLLWSPAGRSKLAMVTAVLVLAVPQVATYLQGGEVERSFFGSYRVADNRDGFRILYSGTTVHGAQSLDPALAEVPLSYYHPDGPVGDWLPVQGDGAVIGVVGLGSGSLTSYLQPGQTMRYHEIDPTVEALARRHFTYLDDAAGEVEVVMGDGRLTLEGVPNGGYDVLLVDAFSSDAIPVHLLTAEAFELYDRVVGDDGVVLVHVSNRYLDLEPVVASGAQMIGHEVRTGQVEADGEGLRAASTWMAVSKNDARMASLDPDMWTVPAQQPIAWTDEHSNIFGVLKR